MILGHRGFTPAIKQGWLCPVCQAVMSPSVPTCFNCTGKKRGHTAGHVRELYGTTEMLPSGILEDVP